MVRAPLPLALRLRNPPPVLIGREAEAELIAARLRSHPLLVLHGIDGVGKLALATHVLHHRFKSRVPRCVYIRPEHGELTTQALIRGLGQLYSKRVLSDHEPNELAFHLAEAAGVWVVVDGGIDAGWTLASLVAHYARASRWVFVGSTPPGEALLEYALEVAPLPITAMTTLARAWQPSIGDNELAVATAAAKGSAWRLRRILADQQAGALAVDGSARRVLDILAACSVPISMSLVHAIVPEATTEDILRLGDRGLADTLPAGILLHPAARALLGPRALEPAIARALVHQLVATGAPLAIGEAARIAIDNGDLLTAARVLDAHGAAVFDAGPVAGLAKALLACMAPTLARWRLCAAVELGDHDCLRAMAGHIPDADHLVWAEGLMRAGLLDEAAEACSASPDPRNGAMIVARARATQGDFARGLAAIAALRALPGGGAALTASSTALAARLYALAGRSAAAREELARLSLADLDEAVLRTVLLAVASARHELGELAAADDALGQLERRLEADPLGRFVGRRANLLRAALLLDRGEGTRATAQLATLARATTPTSLHGRFLAMLVAQRLLGRGEVHEMERVLDEVAPALADNVYLRAWSVALTARARLIDPSIAPRMISNEADGLWPTIARLHVARAALRASDVHVPMPDSIPDPPFELWIASAAFTWEQSLTARNGAHALTTALAAAERAKASGFFAWEAEALIGVTEAAHLLRDHRAQSTARARLATLAMQLDSERFARDATEVFTQSVAELERAAAGPSSPTARRARWLLGQPAEADEIDRVLCEASAGPRAITLAGATSAWRAGWGIDLSARSVWRSDGGVVPFDDKPQLWRVLEALAAAPNGVPKEQLVVQTWGVSYHPLQHDKRLHNAIYKLRKLIELDPAQPRRIPTTETGYRLGADEPVRVVRRN